MSSVMMTWQEVDNPDGASAFVNELQERKETAVDAERLPDPLDYWATWMMIGLIAIVLPIAIFRQLMKRKGKGREDG